MIAIVDQKVLTTGSKRRDYYSMSDIFSDYSYSLVSDYYFLKFVIEGNIDSAYMFYYIVLLDKEQ